MEGYKTEKAYKIRARVAEISTTTGIVLIYFSDNVVIFCTHFDYQIMKSSWSQNSTL